MFYRFPAAPVLHARAPRFVKSVAIVCGLLLLATASAAAARAQAVARELNMPEKGTVSIKNRNGRVSVVASDEQQRAVSIKAESPGAAVEESDVVSGITGSTI